MATLQVAFNEYTQLPIEVVMSTKGAGYFIEVKTPHLGMVIIDSFKVDHGGILSPANTVQKSTDEIIRELALLERDSKRYLIDEWKNSIKN